jgi:two-component system alkaline phosphatase synthesis response regulator PhoP
MDANMDDTRPRPPKILIVDDEPNILISLEFLMKREGYEVVLARDGQEALEAIARERPDLVLLDVMMPGKSGVDVFHEVRCGEVAPDTRIIMLTAKGRETDVAKGLALGADAYMTKPFSTRELVEKVAELLRSRP